jgi:hypothetical protein
MPSKQELQDRLDSLKTAAVVAYDALAEIVDEGVDEEDEADEDEEEDR